MQGEREEEAERLITLRSRAAEQRRDPPPLLLARPDLGDRLLVMNDSPNISARDISDADVETYNDAVRRLSEQLYRFESAHTFVRSVRVPLHAFTPGVDLLFLDCGLHRLQIILLESFAAVEVRQHMRIVHTTRTGK